MSMSVPSFVHLDSLRAVTHQYMWAHPAPQTSFLNTIYHCKELEFFGEITDFKGKESIRWTLPS